MTNNRDLEMKAAKRRWMTEQFQIVKGNEKLKLVKMQQTIVLKEAIRTNARALAAYQDAAVTNASYLNSRCDVLSSYHPTGAFFRAHLVVYGISDLKSPCATVLRGGPKPNEFDAIEDLHLLVMQQVFIYNNPGTGFFIQWAKRAQAKVEQAQVIAEERGSKNMAGTSRGTNPLVDSVR